MEKSNETERVGLVHRTIAFGLAVATTSLIGTSVAVIFSGNPGAAGSTFISIAVAPLRAIFGG